MREQADLSEASEDSLVYVEFSPAATTAMGDDAVKASRKTAADVGNRQTRRICMKAFDMDACVFEEQQDMPLFVAW